MKRNLTVVAAAIAFVLAFGANASADIIWADPLSVDSEFVVGAADGLSGDNTNPDATLIAQYLLDLPADADVTENGPFTKPRRWQTSVTDYSGVLVAGATTNCPKDALGNDTNCSGISFSGFDYAIGKYDGHNAGWILFYLGGQSTTLPETSYAIWGGAGQYGLSNVTVFNHVPDGGSTAALLGSVLVAFGLLRRRLF